MRQGYEKLLQSKCTKDNYTKLSNLNNPKLLAFLAQYVRLCNPQSIFVRTDTPQDADYIRKRAIALKEEAHLCRDGHTVHFDGFFDQARDKEATKYLLPGNESLGKNINALARGRGIKEIKDLLKDSMKHKEMIVCFFGLGPLNSIFFIPCFQITDSFYVAHSEGILYRSAYKIFMNSTVKDNFFKFVHSAGTLENGVSKDIDKRRIYIDLKEDTVFSVNTQYAGNTVGLKKLALRLAIRKASQEGGLAEHMFITGIKGPHNRVTYFCGAYPSACGKTSTAMLKGQTIVGDDIAYLRRIENSLRAVNVECGIFGIIKDVNPQNDPLIWQALTTPGEIIFSNILVNSEGVPYWLGDQRDPPPSGINFSGQWCQGKIDSMGNEIPYAHKNARYNLGLKKLENCDPNFDDPRGVEVGAIIYGGRDSDTWPPVLQAFDWAHGVITMGASLESETTPATLGKEGIRTFNLMSNLDFLSVPIGVYINNHLKFVKDLKKIPLIFAVNYFLRNETGHYLNAIEDKLVWLKWIELRVHNEVEVIETPIGLIPQYQDLKKLFEEYLHKDYTQAAYCKQFTLRVLENLSKIERIVNIYKVNAPDCPKVLFEVLKGQQKRLNEFKERHGNYLDPFKLQDLSKKAK